MKKSGYRTVFHVYFIFLLSLIGIFAAVCCICLSMITVQNPEGKNLRSNWAKIFTQNFSENISFVNGNPQIGQTGRELLRENHAGIQILDNTGKEIYSYQKPENAQNSYSVTDLVHLNQTGTLDMDGITCFVGEVTDEGTDYVYIVYFPIEIQKVTMYLNGERFTGGKRIFFSITGILLVVVTFAGMIYGLYMARAMSHLTASVLDISKRCYLPIHNHGAFRDLYDSLNELDREIKSSDRLREETETMRREWMANITHDLKTPLSPMKGYAEILHDDTDKTPEQCRRYAGIMLKNAIYMENLIEDLKLTWQLENGMLPMERREQNLVRFLRELAIDILNRPEYESRNIRFECDDDTIQFSFDGKLFTRAFQNLIINAFVHGSKDTEVVSKIAASTCCP